MDIEKKGEKTMLWIIFVIWFVFVVACAVMERKTGKIIYTIMFLNRVWNFILIQCRVK